MAKEVHHHHHHHGRRRRPRTRHHYHRTYVTRRSVMTGEDIAGLIAFCVIILVLLSSC